ncbi:MAG: hypothetical protein R3Y22_00685 [Bacteroidales bacterium]
MEDLEKIETRYFFEICSDGTLLEDELRVKLQLVRELYADNLAEFQLYSILSLASIYGVDESRISVEVTRKRLYAQFIEEYTKVVDITKSFPLERSVRYILSKNIVWGDCISADMLGVEDDEVPIEFPIWNRSGNKIKRTDYRLDELIHRKFRVDNNLIKGYKGGVIRISHVCKYRPRHIRNLHSFKESS